MKIGGESSGMSVNITKLEKCPPKKMVPVKVTEMGNVIEVQYMSRRNNKQTIQVLPGGDKYVHISTGEVKDIIHHETRKDQIKSLCRTFANVRAVINTNVTDVSKVRWITLTYAKCMTDTKMLYEDFHNFNKRFQTYSKNQGHGKPEYIAMMEPMGNGKKYGNEWHSGTWHVHMLYIYDKKAPYVSNDDLNAIWGHGFVKIKKLKNVDNVGAYLTAYLGDMEISEVKLSDIDNKEIKQVETEEDGKKMSKYYVKGARLDLYPANFNMIRCSRGIKRPTPEMISLEEAEKKVSAATLTYEKTVIVQDKENDFETIINTRYYNKVRQKNQ